MLHIIGSILSCLALLVVGAVILFAFMVIFLNNFGE